jgi:hypothetical protein
MLSCLGQYRPAVACPTGSHIASWAASGIQIGVNSEARSGLPRTESR